MLVVALLRFRRDELVEAASADTAVHGLTTSLLLGLIDEVVEEDGPIEEDVPLEKVRATPYPLPKEFEWTLVDVEDDKEVKELYELLTHNYVEDDDAMFRFDYSAEFLKWALLPPGWKRAWHIGVRVASNKKLVAFISGIPQDVRVHDKYGTGFV
jgi:glycylpeptide N-tetradecanoyltransferase